MVIFLGALFMTLIKVGFNDSWVKNIMEWDPLEWGEVGQDQSY